ncbi:MAG: aminoglycoside adenylyltransferase domain-containing protein [Actinomycetota bacterium]
MENPTPDVATALGTWLEVVDSVDPYLVEGLYVVGSFALDDWVLGISDIDVVVVTAEPATDEDFGAIRTACALLAERQPLPHVDGPFLAWGDLVVEPATGLHRPWVLHGEPHHDGDCFEINPVTWYELANHGVTVRGPRPDRLGIPTDVEARVRFVVDNLRTYWTDLAEQVLTACDAQPDASFDAASLTWIALGALRLHHTAFTGGVTSKRGAGEWGLLEAPERFHPVLHRALELRARAADDEVGAAQVAEAARLVQWVVEQVD